MPPLYPIGFYKSREGIRLCKKLRGIAYGHIIFTVAAKKKQIYTAFYKYGKRITDYLDISVEELSRLICAFTEKGDNILLTGPGQAILATSAVPGRKGIQVDKRDVHSNASGYFGLGIDRYHSIGADAPDSGPMYMRKSDAEYALEKGRLDG